VNLTVTLPPGSKEYNDVLAWRNYYRDHPEYIGIATGQWNDGKPNYQTRIVLEDQTRERFNQIDAQFANPAPTPDPTPDPSDPFADLKWRQTIGSWAAFRFITRDESNTLKRTHPELSNTLDLLAAYYGPGGFGNVNGARVGNAFFFDNFKTGKREPDVSGAADAFILANSVSADHPNGVPPPSITIP